MRFNTIQEVVEDLKQGKMIILVDDANRENEGDITIAAEKVTPEAINFMLTHARGILCLSINPEPGGGCVLFFHYFLIQSKTRPPACLFFSALRIRPGRDGFFFFTQNLTKTPPAPPPRLEKNKKKKIPRG